MAALVSKLSTKAQTVFPREVRDKLGLQAGDSVRYRFTDHGVIIEKIMPVVEDDPFATFAEWSSPEDDEAFADL